jgi:hypothetical protein
MKLNHTIKPPGYSDPLRQYNLMERWMTPVAPAVSIVEIKSRTHSHSYFTVDALSPKQHLGSSTTCAEASPSTC